jgi:hypothetical protein
MRQRRMVRLITIRHPSSRLSSFSLEARVYSPAWLVMVPLVGAAALAAALAADQLIQCKSIPCYGSGNEDKILERIGNGKSDKIIVRGGHDVRCSEGASRYRLPQEGASKPLFTLSVERSVISVSLLPSTSIVESQVGPSS